MDVVRIGVVGVGNMGSGHLSYLGSVAGAKVTAICDTIRERADAAAKQHGVKAFYDHNEMFKSGLVDAVIIATPHYFHPEIAVHAFENGKHVLCEKPIGVTPNHGRQMIDGHKKHSHLKFGMVFQQRARSEYKAMRKLITDGELGEISRITWIVTDWFRTWAYYASGGWRATWEGEGGGVLLNQCPHNLDLLGWISGMHPNRVTAIATIGKKHPIEVEDEVHAIMEYPNGAVGHFITSTGEAPGTNRLEICGDRGKLIAEGGKLKFVRTRESVKKVLETSPELFAQIETWDIDVPYGPSPDHLHKTMTENFVAAILKNAPLIAPGEEGIRGLEIGNAMLMAGITRKPVELPLDGAAYDAFLKQLIKDYGGKKTLATKVATSAIA